MTVNILKPNKNAVSPTVYIFHKQHKKLFSMHPVEKRLQFIVLTTMSIQPKLPPSLKVLSSEKQNTSEDE